MNNAQQAKLNHMQSVAKEIVESFEQGGYVYVLATLKNNKPIYCIIFIDGKSLKTGKGWYDNAKCNRMATTTTATKN